MNQVILFFFCHPKGREGALRWISALRKASRGCFGSKHPWPEKPPGCGGPKSQINGDLRPPKKKGDDLRATWMGPQGCVHLGWGERCKENVLSNIFRVQFFWVFAVTHVLQMESWTSSTSQASFMTVDHLGGASPPPNNSGSRWWNGDASFGGYVLTDWDVLMIVGFSRP